ncbi:MAG: hypothetical protein ACRBBN_08425 [Methyloligellaceae bacterium]
MTRFIYFGSLNYGNTGGDDPAHIKMAMIHAHTVLQFIHQKIHPLY